MQNDITTTLPAEEQETPNIFGTPNTCFWCGDPAPELVCPECEEKHNAEREKAEAAERAEKVAARRQAFAERVGGYFDTSMTLLPETAAKAAAASYIIGSGAGLTIAGPGGAGKTRSAVWIAQKEMEAGAWVEFRQCGELRQEVANFSRHGEWARGFGPLSRADILILDDFGNHEFTRTVEEFFLALLEKRTAQKKRTFVTTQYGSKALRKLFTTEQMADAVLRRMGPGFATMVNTLDGTIEPWK